MSFKEKLKVAGKELHVLGCSFALKRPSCIIFYSKTSSSGNHFERKDGDIAARKELVFKKACLIAYKEIFKNKDKTLITETFTLSAKEISAGRRLHVNACV